jgi:hypothetical protein
MTAGKRIRAVASQWPAQFVAFDVLAAGGVDVRGRPLTERRLILERALSGIASPIVLCQQTDDVMTAHEWLRTLTAGGIEGVVIKDAAGKYPTREGERTLRPPSSWPSARSCNTRRRVTRNISAAASVDIHSSCDHPRGISASAASAISAIAATESAAARHRALIRRRPHRTGRPPHLRQQSRRHALP